MNNNLHFHKKKHKEYFFKKAKKEHYLARSVYKLIEINKKHSLIKKYDNILELGAAPGSWTQYILKKYKNLITITAIDKSKIQIISSNYKNLKIIKTNVMTWDFSKINKNFNVIISDMSPKTSGIKNKDSFLSFILGYRVIQITERILENNGNICIKLFQSNEVKKILKKMNNLFKIIKIFKPKSSFKRSKEIYIIGLKFKKNSITI